MKKACFNILSILLVAVMVFNMLPLSVLAEDLHGNASSSGTVTDQETDVTPYIVDEVTEKRTEYSKEFRLSNGLHMAAVYADPIHYERSGQWEEIDNTLKAASLNRSSGYTNTAGVWDVHFPGALSTGNAVTVTKDGYTLSFFMSGQINASGNAVLASASSSNAESETLTTAQASTAQVQNTNTVEARSDEQFPETVPDKLHSQLLYADVFTNTNIVYDLVSNEVKESIVIGSYQENLRGYRYTLNTGAMIPVLQENGQILLYDESRENIVMVMPAPYLVDAAGEYNAQVNVSLTGSNGTYTLTYRLPTAWMADEGRSYPVILDPVVRAELDPNNIRDRTVGSEQDMSQTDGSLRCGWQKYFGTLRTYIKYAQLPTLTSADVIVGATMSLYSMTTNTSAYPISVHKVLGSWESETITYNTAPAFDPTVEDYAYIPGQGLYYWDVTDLVRQWYTGPNTGMMFKAPDSIENSTTTNCKKFYS